MKAKIAMKYKSLAYLTVERAISPDEKKEKNPPAVPMPGSTVRKGLAFFRKESDAKLTSDVNSPSAPFLILASVCLFFSTSSLTAGREAGKVCLVSSLFLATIVLGKPV
ncbi:hypothetical protein GOODEAATRI_033243 [Goodea atripinnis]|uniref:Uncharacterized protein n=1 Tax=Goodea atripinnis TaxID=208336 RepID=A0ABV0MMP6_9TELE